METMQCVIGRIIYFNEENGYAVLQVKAEGLQNAVTAVGNFITVRENMELSLKGEWKNSDRYGWQFSVTESEEIIPYTAEGIERYLSSGPIEGMGPVLAKRIVERFGADTLKVLDEQPEKLLKVWGIGKKRIRQITTSWKNMQQQRSVMIFLQGHGLGIASSFRVWSAFGQNTVSVIRENPYLLTSVWGIGFKTADSFAQSIGFDGNSTYRLSAGIEYTLQTSQDYGHCYLPESVLKEKAAELLSTEQDNLTGVIAMLINKYRIVHETPDRLYLPPLYTAETGTAKRIKSILSRQMKKLNISRLLDYLQSTLSISYAEAQIEAIKTAITSKITIITGGPGTGKTTTVRGIITALHAAGMKILLAAPTGRAARKLSEATGMEASTIHRLLEADPSSGFKRNETNRLEGNILIIDESSMIDILLMYSLLQAVPDDMSIIMIGDIDQLPSVGPGNVLKDMISSGIIPVVRLTHIFRQAYGSMIVQNAHRINQGQMPHLKHRENSDFFFFRAEDPAELTDTVIDLCSRRLPAYFNIHPFDIQVLSPMRRGECGVLNLNARLQNSLNPSAIKLQYGNTEFRLYDKVMQIKNNYDKSVFNGDIGQITGINAETGILTVMYEGLIPVPYLNNELDELVLAYAVTVHKAQGSEYEVVVLPVTEQHYVMLQRNLLYTGVTRAKRAIVLAGSSNAVAIAVRNDRITQRYTGLRERML